MQPTRRSVRLRRRSVQSHAPTADTKGIAVRVTFYVVALVLTPVVGVAALFAAHPARTPTAVVIVAGLPALLTALAARMTRRARREALLGTAFAAAAGLAAGIGAALWAISQLGD